jgi:hypothetical protein
MITNRRPACPPLLQPSVFSRISKLYFQWPSFSRKYLKKDSGTNTRSVPELKEWFYYGLDGDRSANIAESVGRRVFTCGRQAGAHHVHQGLAYFPRARSYNLTLFIFEHVNPSGPIKGKNDGGTVHRFLVSCSRNRLILFPVFETAAKSTCGSDESATEQEQAGWFGDIVGGGGKSTESPLINILKRRSVQALDRQTVG